QVASYASRAAADQLIAKLKREHPALIGSRELIVNEAVVGAFGKQYRVWIGPYSAADAKPTCVKLRAAGLDCLPLGQ
ncbi:MAG TPA: SPOR domain-containing protein, partial [Hyphomicrobiaceae bacterium]|nr:SPOR domain-containing protein [Hyphomicrobiaceae bacterium]